MTRCRPPRLRRAELCPPDSRGGWVPARAPVPGAGLGGAESLGVWTRLTARPGTRTDAHPVGRRIL